jgi:hypothetical protein
MDLSALAFDLDAQAIGIAAAIERRPPLDLFGLVRWKTGRRVILGDPPPSDRDSARCGQGSPHQ